MNKYDESFKRRVIQQCERGDESVWKIARDHDLDHGMLRLWIENYRQHGESSLRPKRVRHSTEFKLQVLERVRRGDLSGRQVAALFDIRCTSTIGRWERQYNEGRLTSPPPPKRKTSMPTRSDDDQRSREQLLDELKDLRAENAYLKKLDALIREQKAAQAKKRKSSRD